MEAANSLCENNITDAGVRSVAEALDGTCLLKTLRFGEIWLGSSQLKLTYDHIRYDYRIARNKFTDASQSLFLEAATRCQAITSIRFGWACRRVEAGRVRVGGSRKGTGGLGCVWLVSGQDRDRFGFGFGLAWLSWALCRSSR